MPMHQAPPTIPIAAWNDIRSQPFACDLLRRSLRRGRAHHGYLFAGDSSETERVALAFVRALNCERGDGDFCDQCPSCAAIVKNQHPDVYGIRPESRSRRIVIAQVRELERSVSLKASRARTKAAIVHGADRLQPEAQDAFLKTLEEPPPKTVFLLLTEEPQQLKDTILSRCLRVPFRPVPRKQKSERDQQVEQWLEEFAAPVSPSESTVFRAYGFTGKILGLLKEMRDERLKEAEGASEDPSMDNLTASQRERWEEQMEAQAQADYLRERSSVLKLMVEWHHERGAGAGPIEILEKLARRLARNVNESLAWEIAMLELASANSDGKPLR